MAVGGGLALAMAVYPAEAGADPAGGSGTSPSSASGPISEAINDFGQSLCPKLVKPASDLATTVSEMQGNSGLTPAMTGMVTGLAVQLECPAFMTSVANGNCQRRCRVLRWRSQMPIMLGHRCFRFRG